MQKEKDFVLLCRVAIIDQLQKSKPVTYVLVVIVKNVRFMFLNKEAIF